MEEAWRPVVGYESLYEVSDHGRIRSLDKERVRLDGKALRTKGRILKQSKRNQRQVYLCVTLIDKEGAKAVRYVHAIVAEAWIGPRPTPKHEVLHKDDVGVDNRATSLRWGTRLENEREKKRKTMCRKGLHELPDVPGKRTCLPCRRVYEREKRAAA